MKNQLNSRLVLVLMLITSITFQVNASKNSNFDHTNEIYQNTGKKKMVQAVRFDDSWIPSIQLKEVEISATSSHHQIVEAVIYQGKLIPSVQMNEVTINSSNVYNKEDEPALAFVEPNRSGFMTDVALYNGEFIPSIQLNEVTINGTQLPSEKLVDNSKNGDNASEGFLKVNTRQTFNILVDLIAKKSLQIIRHFIPVRSEK